MDTQPEASREVGKYEKIIKVLVVLVFVSIGVFNVGMTIRMVDFLRSPVWLANVASASVWTSLVVGAVSLVALVFFGFRARQNRRE